MAFTTMYCLHKAILISVLIVCADVLANRLGSSWGAYDKRTVGRQWMIWSLGMLSGFLLHRIMIRSLILDFAPEVVPYFMKHPEKMLSNTTILMILIPYWVIGISITFQVVKTKQWIQQQAGSVMVLTEGSTSPAASSAASFAHLPKGSLKLEDSHGNGIIALADITHVTVEDHYCRINCSTSKGLKGAMVRLPLKHLIQKLPQEYFLKIHRSHIVNLGHVARLTKTGRDFKVLLKAFGVQLPVSRSRYKDLQHRLKLIGRDIA